MSAAVPAVTAAVLKTPCLPVRPGPGSESTGRLGWVEGPGPARFLGFRVAGPTVAVTPAVTPSRGLKEPRRRAASESESPPESDSESESGSPPESPESDSESDSESPPESDSKSDSESPPESDSESESESHPESDSESESESPPESDSESDSGSPHSFWSAAALPEAAPLRPLPALSTARAA